MNLSQELNGYLAFLSLFLLITLGLVRGQEPGARIFTDTMGRQSLATIAAATAETVTLRGQGGREVTLQISTLSEADRQFVGQWIEQRKVPMSVPVPVPPLLPTPVRGKVEYTDDGSPTAFDEEIRWLVNRGRFDSAKENALRGSSYRDVPASTGPLAPHQSLTAAARRHAEDMARNSRMQHETVPKSTYYNAATQRTPWSRFAAEGYLPGNVAENISAGRDTPSGNYLGWWKSTGHRANMFRSTMREIGTGYFVWPASRFKSYCAMTLGGPEMPDFLTCTLFHDAAGRGTYSEGSGVGGIRIDLRCGQAVHDYFDVSTAVGSFAVQLDGIPPGSHVEVLLTNTNAAPVKLTIPQNYENFSTRELAPGEQQTLGFFTRTDKPTNVGFRNVIHSAGKEPLAKEAKSD